MCTVHALYTAGWCSYGKEECRECSRRVGGTGDGMACCFRCTSTLFSTGLLVGHGVVQLSRPAAYGLSLGSQSISHKLEEFLVATQCLRCMEFDEERGGNAFETHSKCFVMMTVPIKTGQLEVCPVYAHILNVDQTHVKFLRWFSKWIT